MAEALKVWAPTITEVVKELRLALGDTQQQFAQRLGLAISTVVRYESTRAPRGPALAQMVKLAIENGFLNIGRRFQLAIIHDQLGSSALTSPPTMLAEPRTDEEFAVAEAAVMMWRDPLEREALAPIIGPTIENCRNLRSHLRGSNKLWWKFFDLLAEGYGTVQAYSKLGLPEGYFRPYVPLSAEGELDALIQEKLQQYPEMSRERAFADVCAEHDGLYGRVIRQREILAREGAESSFAEYLDKQDVPKETKEQK
jgi:transcriptional regulator with XRE-family HTH domain